MKAIAVALLIAVFAVGGCGSDSSDTGNLSGNGDGASNGEPDDGEPDDGEPDDVEPDDGEPGDGEPDDGEPDDGEPDDGEPDDGEPDDGEPDDGEPDDGEPDDGEPDDSSEPAGEPDESEPEPANFCNNDGVVDDGERCDDGNRTNSDSCLNSCNWNLCGDGYWLREITDDDGPGELEECDDGNSDGGYDGCHDTCEVAYCGDGIRRSNEQCEPGDTHPDDPRIGCRSGCVWDFPESNGDVDAGDGPDDIDASTGVPDAGSPDAGGDDAG